MADEPQLSQGDSGDWVTYLQQMLGYAGYSPGAVDGNFGQSTEDAVKSYQQASGLGVTGVVDAQTWAALGATSSTATSGAGTGDAATSGTGTPDAGTPDAGTPDAGTPDAGTGGTGAADAGAAGGDVPADLVQAGAPSDFAQWTDEQKNAFFANTMTDNVTGDPPQTLAVADIPSEGDGGVVA